jgi:hypothetical protein
MQPKNTFFNWINANRPARFVTWEDQHAAAAELGYDLIPAEEGIGIGSKVMREAGLQPLYGDPKTLAARLPLPCYRTR